MRKILKVIQMLRVLGPGKLFSLAFRKVLGRKVKNYEQYRELFRDMSGIEIGGPSPFFFKQMPIYDVVKALDGVNFSTSTVWEGELKEGPFYRYGNNRTGHQFIRDAVDLGDIPAEKYDFVLSCNNLEHIANPMKAVKEWLRILRKDGIVLLVLPDKTSNFDHARETTRFEHLLDDFNNNTQENDLTHVEEILSKHDLMLDLAAGTRDQFRVRSMDNFTNRCLHHHVYDVPLLRRVLEHFNVKVIMEGGTGSNHIIVGRK